jgi:xanthine dehydrogenase YagT iron-sulfur-binding subunit
MDDDRLVVVEGLGQGEELHSVQPAFLEGDGFQYGYCTPRQICSVVAHLAEHARGELSAASFPGHPVEAPPLAEPEIRERMSGNLCRCVEYPNIVAAASASLRPASTATSEGNRCPLLAI